MNDILVRDCRGPGAAQLRQALVRQLGADGAGFARLGNGDLVDSDVEAAARRWQSGVGLVADGVVGPYCQSVLGLRGPVPMEIALDLESVKRLFPATKPANINRYLPYVGAALQAAGLTDRTMLLAALATIRAESEGFLPIPEHPSQFNTRTGQAPFGIYDGSRVLGNTEPGDGARFKGRGFVQLTGRFNYGRYGQALGIDLLNRAELANAPEVAAVLLARFLADRADALRAAIHSGKFAQARRLVNGGVHGLDRFRDVFRLAEQVWPPATAAAPRRGRAAPAAAPVRGRAATAAAPSSPAGTAARTLNVRRDPVDLRDRPYAPPPVGLQDAFPSDAEIGRFLPAYGRAGMVLDQGQEGACTGFGLACVVNYLRWRKAGLPTKMESVSPRMLYNFARRYDEYAGEDYEGSSCRGALKGWFNHGVCLDSDWPYATGSPQPRYGFAGRASAHTVGVYYRIDRKSITDLQAAIQQVGAVYGSAFTHDGWNAVAHRMRAPGRHLDLAPIPFDGRPSRVDGHAFALVGFNRDGFIVQNSWGRRWGSGGFAVIRYADWLANAMDAWVVAMGVPGVVAARVGDPQASSARAGAAADTSAWWSLDQAYRHSVVLGNDGRIKRYLTEDELSRTLLHQVAALPDQWFRAQGGARKRLVVYAHGGLNSEDAAMERARAMGRHFLGNACYPLFMVWKTGLLESLSGIVSDAFHQQPPLAGAVGEWLSERTDLLIEKSIGRPLARPIWSEMKENAELAFGQGRGGDLMVGALLKLAETWGEAFELHLVGHSAGAIVLGHMLSALVARGLGPRVASLHLLAPACTVQFANRHYAAQPELLQRLYLHLLSDRVERNDNVAAIYRKSLLYFVSNALEVDLRTPILGLANSFVGDYAGWDGTSSTGNTLKAWRDAAQAAGFARPGRVTLIDADKVPTALGRKGTPQPAGRRSTGQLEQLMDATHGSFDNDLGTMSTTLERILGGPLPCPIDDLRGF